MHGYFFIISLTIFSCVTCDRHDQPPNEDALDAVADEHVAKENDDIFWFAFLIGGIGTVVLIIRYAFLIGGIGTVVLIIRYGNYLRITTIIIKSHNLT